MNRLNAWISSWTSPYAYPTGLRVFSALVYFWFVLSAFLVWDIRTLLWGQESVMMRYGMQADVSLTYAYALMFSPELFPFIFYPHVVAAVVSMFQFRGVFIFRIITWLTGILLFFAAPNAFNAGFLLMLLLAFYCIPVNTKNNKPWQHILHHAAAYAAMIQVALAYGFSAMYKISGDMWLNGDAVYYALELRRFSSEWISGITQYHGLMKMLTWTVLAYQALFPFLVWFKKVKAPLLWFGVAMHLIIGIVMHLWDFSAAMLIAYVAFWKKA